MISTVARLQHGCLTSHCLFILLTFDLTRGQKGQAIPILLLHESTLVYW